MLKFDNDKKEEYDMGKWDNWRLQTHTIIMTFIEIEWLLSDLSCQMQFKKFDWPVGGWKLAYKMYCNLIFQPLNYAIVTMLLIKQYRHSFLWMK